MPLRSLGLDLPDQVLSRMMPKSTAMEMMPLVRSGRALLLCIMTMAVSVACVEAVGDDAFTYMDNGEISISFLLDLLRWPFF